MAGCRLFAGATGAAARPTRSIRSTTRWMVFSRSSSHMLIVMLVAILDIAVPGSYRNDRGRHLNFAKTRHY